MEPDGRRAHWETVYATKAENEVSWFQDNPSPSLEAIALTGATPASAIIDIGGGASRLVDHLLALGFVDVTVGSVVSEFAPVVKVHTKFVASGASAEL